MHFVPVKTAQQQGQLAVHRLREGFKEERTALINRVRGLLAEFGLVFTLHWIEIDLQMAWCNEHIAAHVRTLLIQGAKSAVMSATKRSDRISQWLVRLKERVGWQKTVVALANKNARILWAVLTRDGVFDPDHVPQIPPARQKRMAV